MSIPESHVPNQDHIWAYFQNQSPDVFLGNLARLTFLARQLERSAKVLNIGVGSGLFEEVASCRGLDCYSLDPNEQSILSLQKRLGVEGKARVGYSQEIPFPEQYFDAVVVSEVLEHLDDDTLSKSLGEIARVLKPGARVLGTVPSKENLRDQIVVCPHCTHLFHRWGHLQSFDVPRLAALLSKRFEILKLHARPFAAWSRLNWKGKCFAGAKSLLWYCGIHGSNESIVFIAQKRSANPSPQP